MDTASTIVLAASLVIIMLGMGLSLVLEDFKRIIIQPKAIILGLINQIIFLPLIGFGIVLLFNLGSRPEIAVGIMILAACPGGPTSNLIAHLSNADTALSVSLTALSSFITILTIPFIINFALEFFYEEGQIVKLNIASTIIQIFIIIVIPVSIGMFIRWKKENFAFKMARPVRIASGIVLALVIIGIVIKDRANFVSYFQQAGIVALVLNVTTMLVGYLTARLFKVVNKRALSISIESGIQNGTLAITIALVLLERTDFAIAPAIYSLIMFFTGGVVIYFGNRKKRVLAEKAFVTN